MNTLKLLPWLYFILGAWIAGSILVGWQAGYNFSGYEDLFARNPKLAAHAGFELDDDLAKKTSLLWVYSSELNRVLFESWNRVQLVLGSLALLLSLGARQGWIVFFALLLSLCLVAFSHFFLEWRIVELGRQLDFTPRVPPPSELESFKSLHRLYFTTEMIRFIMLVAAALLVLIRPKEFRDAYLNQA